MNKREIGSRYEEAAAAFFAKTGLSYFREKFPVQTRGDRSGMPGGKRTGVYRGKVQIRYILGISL